MCDEIERVKKTGGRKGNEREGEGREKSMHETTVERKMMRKEGERGEFQWGWEGRMDTHGSIGHWK